MAEIVGIDNVLNYCDRYTFQRIKLSRSGDVIFTRRQGENETQADLMADFENFIKDTIRPGNFKEYKLELMGTYSDNPNAKLSPVVKIGVCFYDKPSSNISGDNSANYKNLSGGVDVEKYIQASTRAAMLEAQIERLEEKIEQLNEPDDDEPEAPQGIGAALNSALIEKLPAIIDYVLIRIAGGNAEPTPAINGIPENDILTEFKKIHPDIENDLRRLYQLAQTKPDFFNMLIVNLRNMIN